MKLVRSAAARFGLGLGLALSLAAAGRAGTLFRDAYGTGAPDVLGDPDDSDIRSLEVQTLDPTTLAISVRMNRSRAAPAGRAGSTTRWARQSRAKLCSPGVSTG